MPGARHHHDSLFTIAAVAVWIVSSSALSATTAHENYPTKPIRFVVPFPAGGGTDLLTRNVATELAAVLGKPVIVDNRPGAGTNIGTALVARAEPDGYTLLMGSTGMAVNPALYKDAGYDPKNDFSPVSLVGTACNLLVVHPSVPVNSVRELISLASARPGKLNFATFGAGTSSHLSAELFKHLAKVDMVHVPYKGAAPALLSVLTNETQLMFAGIISGLPHAKSGRLRGLAVTSAKRAAAAPDLPTVAETLPGFEVVSWYAIFAPAGTPKHIVQRLHMASDSVLRRPQMRQQLLSEGTEVVASTPAELGKFVRGQVTRWQELVRALNLTPQS